LLFFVSTIPGHLRFPLFPYTTLFRSLSFQISPPEATAAWGCAATLPAPKGPGLPAARAPFSSGGCVSCGFSRRRRFPWGPAQARSEEHTSELQSRENLVCRLLHEKKN